LYSFCDAPDDPADERVDDDVEENRDAVNENNYFCWFAVLQNKQIESTWPENDCELVEASGIKRVMAKQIKPDNQQYGGDEKTDTAEGEQDFEFHRIFPIEYQSPSADVVCGQVRLYARVNF
jgi:hypothetical protein